MKRLLLALILVSVGSTALAATSLDASFAASGRYRLTSGNFYKGVLAHLPKSDGGSILVSNYHDVDGSGNQINDDAILLQHVASSGALGSAHSVLAATCHFARVGAAAIDSQGRIIVVGSTSATFSQSDFRVARILPNGVLDTSFNGDGIAEIDFAGGGNNDDQAHAVAIDSQDRIVVVGQVERGATGDFDFGIARLTATGAPDASFGGGDGKVFTYFDLGPSLRFDAARAVVIGSNGLITVAGGAYDGTLGVNRIAIARLFDSGSLDANFCLSSCNYMDTYTTIHSGRRVIFYGTASPARSDQVASMAINADGALLIAGTTPGSGETLGFIQRFDPSGNWTHEVATQGGASGQTFIGGVHWTHDNTSNSDIILTGASGPNEEFFFAQRFDAFLFAKLDWGFIGPSNSVYLWTASGGFGDVGDNRPARSSLDANKRVLVGGRYKANLPTDPYSAVGARLTSTDAPPAGIDIFRNGFE